MIETRNDSVGIVRLKLSVYVLLGVHINKRHTSAAIVVVATAIVNTYDVFSFYQLGSFKVDEPISQFGL